ncbi:hypothetical protein SSCG_00820 [Streptomyces clavuligerus]|nr:hypothetical protein SSCG_00820 [Streptomyces clavuligerus]
MFGERDRRTGNGIGKRETGNGHDRSSGGFGNPSEDRSVRCGGPVSVVSCQ